MAYLNNVTSGAVHEVINGEYTTSFICQIEPLKTEYLYNPLNLVEYDNDYFRVAQLEELHNEDDVITVSITVEHISYDLINNTMANFSHANKAAIFVMNEALLNTNFIFNGTDVTTTASIDLAESVEGAADLNVKNIIHNIALIWGGELQYFRNQIELLQQRGQNRGVDFRFGKNIKNIKRIVNFTENTISYDVAVVQGAELEELGFYDIGDTIRVIDDALGLDYEVRIIELTRDIITGINSQVILGQPIKDLSSQFSDIFDGFKRVSSKLDQVALDFGNAISTINSDVETLQQAIADGVIVTYYQELEPATIDLHIGDMWFCMATSGTYAGKLWRWNGIAWDLIEDAGITAAIEAASNAQTTADGKIKTFYTNAEPTAGMSTGDIWFDTDNKNKQYRYSGTAWVSVRDLTLDTVDTVIDVNGKLIASKIAGTLSTAVTTITDGTGYVTFSSSGILVHNQPTEAASTWAVKISSGGILISNAKDTGGAWIWRTALTGVSISADAMTTGTLSAININSVNITGSTITGSTVISENGTFQVILNNGTLIFKDTAIGNDGLQIQYAITDPTTGKASVVIAGDINDSFLVDMISDDMLGGDITLRLNVYDNGSSYRLIEQEMLWKGSSGTYGPWGEYNITFDSDSYVAKNAFNVRNGSKNAIIETEKFGDLSFSAYEMNEVILGFIGESEVVNGVSVINLEEKLLACINTDLPYQVFLQAYSDGRVYIEQRNTTNFVVKGDNVKFGYEIKAKRKKFEEYNFGFDEVTNE